MADFEKLGVFYLGRPYDLATKQGRLDAATMYDSRDLVTHAVCVGMTGSGKTGLCTCLLEEAAIDGIPSIVIDPKGDMTNLLLQFPGLTQQEFRPWINEDDARNKGMSPDDYAKSQADMWKQGLASWGQDGARIQKLHDSAEFAIYTPASGAGIPVSILKSFAAPPAVILDDGELLAEHLNTTTTGLLSLLGIDADPVRSREHILIASIFKNRWMAGQDLDIAGLIQKIQAPPMQQIGALPIDSFYPAKDRFALAMRLNNLLAAPGFDLWLQGVPLDIGSFLHTASGKPKVSVMFIAHLNDTERMFFVSLLLGQVVAWMRSQSGTTSLRSILYMDEIFGYFPPVANPPSKMPLLTLLKQARAFGLGVVLATQNPVDLDYKGLSNCGTWLLGRLQTERDKLRVLEGLESVTATAGGNFDRSKMDSMLSSLGKRIFLLHNVNKSAPEVFETRWALSYLRGPLTRDQVRTLMAPIKSAIMGQTPQAASVPMAAQAGGAARPVAALSAAPASVDTSLARPVLPPAISQYFMPATGKGPVSYTPLLYAAAHVAFADVKTGVNDLKDVAFLSSIVDGPVAVDWTNAEETDVAPDSLASEPAPGAAFGLLPAPAARPQSYAQWRSDFSRWLQQSQTIELLRSPSLGVVSNPGETESAFRVRLQLAAREHADGLKDQLIRKYQPKLQLLEERKRKAQQAVDRQKAQANEKKVESALSLGSTIFSALFGGGSSRRRGTLGRATTAAKTIGRTMKESGDVGRAQDTVEAIDAQIRDLQKQFEKDTRAAVSASDARTEELDKVVLKPKATGVSVQVVSLVWYPN
jgi:hypothetical protein